MDLSGQANSDHFSSTRFNHFATVAGHTLDQASTGDCLVSTDHAHLDINMTHARWLALLTRSSALGTLCFRLAGPETVRRAVLREDASGQPSGHSRT
ncbi:hypothetical protein ElyMa_004464700 [Elysia marginata]|uniref:Uncharacterized protein n=1 Tax=Elysia marginata TaxID=1093978 RepID=A0AAV4HFA9_9GAST|nr:hypothetical protein ElyMa_004464700 [Elysia marginata]